jgi:hypothetical protein
MRNLGRPGRLGFSTIKSFEGLKANQVILFRADLPDRSQAFASEHLYVACTRATGRQAILVSADEAGNGFAQNVT